MKIGARYRLDPERLTTYLHVVVTCQRFDHQGIVIIYGTRGADGYFPVGRLSTFAR